MMDGGNLATPYPKGPCTQRLRFWVIVIIVLVVGEYMIARCLDP